MISPIEIDKLAALARIQLSVEEKKKLQKDIGAILEYVKQVQNISPARGGIDNKGGINNVFREDVSPHESGIFTETLLAAAPAREGQYIKVKKIL